MVAKYHLGLGQKLDDSVGCYHWGYNRSLWFLEHVTEGPFKKKKKNHIQIILSKFQISFFNILLNINRLSCTRTWMLWRKKDNQSDKPVWLCQASNMKSKADDRIHNWCDSTAPERDQRKQVRIETLIFKCVEAEIPQIWSCVKSHKQV